MPTATTAVLAIAAVGVAIYTIGISRTTSAVGSAAGTARGAVTRGKVEAAAGLGAGLMFGEQVLQFAMTEPFGVLSIVAGVFGALGIEGMLGGISGAQFLLIGFIGFGLIALWRA